MLHTAHRFVLLSVVALATAAAAPQEEGNRYALVVGNNSYIASPLQNAVNDARIMDKALKDAGFRSTLLENASLVALQSAAGEFLSKIGPSDTALFFYAGHGVQIENENFLVPVDFEAPNSVVAAKFRLFSVAQLFDGLRNRPKRSIVVLDACRSNPIAQQNALSAGLAQPQNSPNESYVVFSTGPGQTAADNPNGRNSYFTEALAVEIAKPGLTIEEVVNHTRATVSSETNGNQTPWAISSLKTTFFFHPPLNLEAESAASMALKWMADAKRFEQREEWDDAIDRINQIVRKKPGGNLQAAAENRLGYLTARRDAQASFDQGDYAAAAKAYETAFTIDPFAIDAAFEGVDSYLLQDQVDPAVRLLHAIRVRGTTESTAKAIKYLAELNGVNPLAAREVSAAIPEPPPIEEMFSGVRFGVPDWEGGRRILTNSPVDPARFIKDIGAMAPAVQPPAAAPTGGDSSAQESANQTAAMSQLLKDIFHLELAPTSETRDLVIKRAAAGTLDSNAGLLLIEGPDKQIPVLYQSQIHYLPAKLALQAGKYEVRSIQDGKVVGTQEIEISAGWPQKIVVKR
jgi:tetratricopeptide (TPR) repeat protein